MPVSKREEALAAAADRLEAIAGTTFYRNPNFILSSRDVPFVVQYDGEESVDPETSDYLRVHTQLTVLVGVEAARHEAIGPALNELIARVRVALGADPTLGEAVTSVQYMGAEEPILLVEDGAAPRAQCALNFELNRQEAEFDPYSFSNGA